MKDDVAVKKQSVSPIQNKKAPGRAASEQIATRDDADLPHVLLDDPPTPSRTNETIAMRFAPIM